MNLVEKVLDGVQSFMNVNSATFSGAVDIIVVPQEDGSLACTSWHVRFGKLQLINTSEKKVRCPKGLESPHTGLKVRLAFSFSLASSGPCSRSFSAQFASTAPLSSTILTIPSFPMRAAATDSNRSQ